MPSTCAMTPTMVEFAEVSPGVVLDYNESNEVEGGRDAPSLETLLQPEPLRAAVRDGLSMAGNTGQKR